MTRAIRATANRAKLREFLITPRPHRAARRQ
jgi:hypothetical protein